MQSTDQPQQKMKTKHITTLQLRNSINRSPLRLGLLRVQSIWIIRGLLLIPLALGCFALSQTARAVTPAPDGGYPNGNTAEGTNALFSLTTGSDNTAIGFKALFDNTGGRENTAMGFQALFNNTGSASDIGGSQNTATGFEALFHNTGGVANTANGDQALFHNTVGYENTATGSAALFENTKGYDNTATGFLALQNNTHGYDNTATGVEALQSNTTGFENTATGLGALASNTTGHYNTATGLGALHAQVTGNSNTATGVNALFGDFMFFTSTGSNNTANGYQALYSYTTGDSNTANGVNALYFNTTGSFNTANGRGALYHNTIGANNVTLGYRAGFNLTTGNCNIDIGNLGAAGESATTRIGTNGSQTNTYVAGISGVTVAGGVGVIVDSSGHLGTVVSSERFKDAIKPMDKASEAILALKPVTFRYKQELDPKGIPQFGLIAEEVEKVNPDLVVRDANGKVNTVRYEAVNAMLLNEFLKEHRKIQDQEATITQLKSGASKQEAIIAKQQKQIETLTAGLQKVSAQLETSKPAPQMVLNDQQ
jgi:uncharacterized coiled-coil protein SlyX